MPNVFFHNTLHFYKCLNGELKLLYKIFRYRTNEPPKLSNATIMLNKKCQEIAVSNANKTDLFLKFRRIFKWPLFSLLIPLKKRAFFHNFLTKVVFKLER